MGSCCVRKNESSSLPLAGESKERNFTSRVPNWKKGALIGAGAYGKVYECLNLETGELHAVKQIELSGSPEQIYKEVYYLKKEILTLKNLYHKNIVQYICTEINAECNGVNILMEYVSGGSLRHLLNKLGKFEEPMAVLYIEQVLRGLSYLHEQGIVHRDIKSANILVSQDGVIKLSDFGASKKIKSEFVEDENEICKSLKGSPYWMAPEVAARIGHSYAADIWSVGCVMIEMLTGASPWSTVSRSVKEILKLIISGQTPPIPSEISKDCKSFISACLQENQKDRPTAQELLSFPLLLNKELCQATLC
jgi:mitogen-activated protein kinase kinase kinase